MHREMRLWTATVGALCVLAALVGGVGLVLMAVSR